MSVAPLPERRLMHEIAGDGRERHHMRKAEGHTPGICRSCDKDAGHYVCECGARSDRFGNLIPEVPDAPAELPRWWQ